MGRITEKESKERKEEKERGNTGKERKRKEKERESQSVRGLFANNFKETLTHTGRMHMVRPVEGTSLA